MDKNIAAFIRDNTKTVGVRFFKDYNESGSNNLMSLSLGDKNYRLSDKEYTYVTMEDFQIGDYAVVIVAEVPKVVVVTRVDDDLDITPNEEIQYKWIVCRVGFEEHTKRMKENAELSKTLAKGYQRNMKNSFRKVLIENLGEEEQNKILQITSPTIVKPGTWVPTKEGEVK